MAIKCIICGRPVLTKIKKEIISYEEGNNSSTFLLWKKDCAKTLCDILFENDSFVNYFETADYCSSCEKTTRDVNFTWKLIASLKSRLEELATIVRKRLNANYLSLEQKSDTNILNEVITVELLGQDQNQDNNRDNYSFHQTVEMFYKAAGGCVTMPWGMIDDEELFPEEKVGQLNVDDYLRVKLEQFDSECDIDDEESISKFSNLMEESTSPNLEASAIEYGYGPKSKRRRRVGVPVLNYNEGDNKMNCFEEGSANADAKFILKKGFSNKNKKRNKSKGKITKDLKKNERDDREPKQTKYSRMKDTVKCEIESCELKFRSKVDMEGHVLYFHKGISKPFQCPKCPKRYRWKKSIREHLLQAHDSEQSEFTNCCKFCNKGYKGVEELDEHYAVAHQGPNPFVCAFCDIVCTNFISLKIHTQQFHPDVKKPKCNVCGKLLASQTTLRYHMLIHRDPDSLFKCEICSHISATNSRLQKHMKSHDETRSIICEICGKGFKDNHALKGHNRVHTGAKAYDCKICGKGFRSGTEGRRHEERVHLKVKNYVCTVCGRPFGSRSHLLDHEKIHQRERQQQFLELGVHLT